MLKAKRILIAAGGTGGHINPALSVAGYIRSQDPTAEILFVGTADKMEAKLVPQAGYPIKMIDISGFRRDLSPAGIVHNIKTVSKMFKSSSQAKKIIEDFKPELAIGFGGYVSGPYTVGGMPLYVSSGSGLWGGIPLRLFVPSEITLITLTGTGFDTN